MGWRASTLAGINLVFMNEAIPDIAWYVAKSQGLGMLPRCPFASTERCPRYYQSLSLLDSAGITPVDSKEDKRLLSKWKRHPLWPKTMEQTTGIGSIESGPVHYSNFCPEVTGERFNVFAGYLARYADEIDKDLAHWRLGRENAPLNHPRWNWQSVSPQHYAECPLYSSLAHADELRQRIGAPAATTSVKRTQGARSTRSGRSKATETPIPDTADSDKKLVFISYAHADSKWINRFERHLKPLLRDKAIDAWSDQKIRISERWHDEIQKSLAKACAAVLLISPDFLASDYITNHELPEILKRAADRGVQVFSIILAPCGFDEVTFTYLDRGGRKTSEKLSVFQAVNPPSKTLSEMKLPEWERTLLKAAKEISALGGTPSPTTKPKKVTIKPIGNTAPATSDFPVDLLSVLGASVLAAQKKGQSVVCVNNLKHLGLAARIWAREHVNTLPANFLELKPAPGGGNLQFKCPSGENLDYQILSPSASTAEPSRVYARCKFHNLVVLADGSVQQLGERKLVKLHGVWRIPSTSD